MKRKNLIMGIAVAGLFFGGAVWANENGTKENSVEFTKIDETRWDYEYILSGETPEQEKAKMLQPPSAFENHYSFEEIDVRKQEFIEQINEVLTQSNQTSLEEEEKYSEVAMMKAQDMFYNQYFDENSPTHGTPLEMMEAHGYQVDSVQQWIKKGDGTTEELLQKWLTEELTHQENVRVEGEAKYGFGMYGEKGTDNVYWVLLKVKE